MEVTTPAAPLETIPAVATTERVQLESKTEYYQGDVLLNTNTKHGEGTLIDKDLMTQYTGTFQMNIKHGETC